MKKNLLTILSYLVSLSGSLAGGAAGGGGSNGAAGFVNGLTSCDVATATQRDGGACAALPRDIVDKYREAMSNYCKVGQGHGRPGQGQLTDRRGVGGPRPASGSRSTNRFCGTGLELGLANVTIAKI